MQLIFDMGGTKTRMAVVRDGKMGEVVRLPTDKSDKGFESFVGSLADLAGGESIEAVVGGMPGQLEGEEGSLVWAPNLTAWLGTPVLANLRERLGCPVTVHNDVVVGGLGEAHDGAGITKGVMAYFTVSTGVNAVRIVDGRPDASIERFEIGQQLLAESDGKFTTLESRIGGAAMEKRYGKAPGEIRDAEVWKQAARDLSGGLYNTLLHWTPEVVVFGGSMMRDIDLKVVREELEGLPKVLAELPSLEYAELGDTAGLHGALALVMSLERK